MGFATLVATAGGSIAAGLLVVRRRLDHLRGSARAAALGLTITTALLAVHLVPGAANLLYPGVVAACALLLAALCALIPHRPAGGADEPAPEAPADRPTSRALAALSVLAIAAACIAYLRLAVDRAPTGIDALTFHLPDVARWAQNHGFWQIHQFVPGLAHGNYPNNGDVLSLLAVLPFHDIDLARLVFIPWLALTGICVHALARELGAPRASAAIFAAAAVALPAVAKSTADFVDPDAVMYATFTAGLLFLARHRRTGARTDLVLAGVGLGLALGTKWYGASAFVVVAALWGGGRLLEPAARRGLTRDALVLGAVALAAGGFWLLRNLVLSGNPIFPVRIGLGGLTLFDAPPDLVRARGGFTLAHYAGDTAIWRDFVWPAFKASYGLALPAFALGALGAAWLGRANRTVLGFAVLALLLGVMYVLTPYSAQGPAGQPLQVEANTRYGVPALLVAAALCAWLAGRLGRGRLVAEAAGALLVVDGARRAFDVPTRTVVTTVVLLAIAGVGLWAARVAVAGHRRLAPALGAVLVVLAFATARHLDTHFDDAPWQVDAALALAHAQDGKRIGIAGQWPTIGIAPALPAFGARLDNHVVYLGPFERHMLRQYSSGAAFLARTRREHVDLLLLGRGFPRAVAQTREERWARAAGWRLLARSPRFTLYGR